jgi:hypothetical protein
MAVRNRSAGVSLGVIARNAGAVASGSTITNNELARQQDVFGQVQGNQIKGGWEKLSCQIASGAAARMNSFFGKEADDIWQFPAVGGGFPFAIHVQKAHAPEIFTLHPVTDACFWNRDCWNDVIHKFSWAVKQSNSFSMNLNGVNTS